MIQNDGGYGSFSSTPKTRTPKKKPPKKQTERSRTRVVGNPQRDEGYGSVKTTREKEKLKSAAGRRWKSLPELYRERLPQKNDTQPLWKENKYTHDMNQYRKMRAKNKIHQGKYYGPDQFKGNINLVDAWRKEGSQDAGKWLKNMTKRKREYLKNPGPKGFKTGYKPR
jgi:hypothetical protein